MILPAECRSRFVFVCAAFEVPRSACREFRVDGRRVLICEDGGGYYAHSAVCPHQEYSLDGACLWNGSINCPWHGYTFDVVTGRNEYPGRVYPVGIPGPSKAIGSLDTFATELRGDRIYVAF
jgi:nitrite reductase/ring-hydroxylating ferredoxin subunit